MRRQRIRPTACIASPATTPPYFHIKPLGLEHRLPREVAEPTRGWVATNEEMTHRVLAVRAERVVAHGPAPRGFLVHGGEPMLWTAYVNGGHVPHGVAFLRAVRDLAERAGVDASPLDRPEPRDRRADLLEDFVDLAHRELASERGEAARTYLEARGLPAEFSPQSLCRGNDAQAGGLHRLARYNVWTRPYSR